MKSFELKLGNTLYKCSGNHFQKDQQNWHIQAEMEGARISIELPIESKLTTIQVMAFLERLHEGMMLAKESQHTKVEYAS